MFSRTKKGADKAQASISKPSKSHPPSLVSADLHVIGNLKSDGDIHIDGNVDGDILTKVLVVGETANVRGKIIADTIHVHGNVNGEIKARSVNLAKTAHVIGDILHEDLSIDAGAFLEGHCKRIIEKKATDDDDGSVKPATDRVKQGHAGKVSSKTPSISDPSGINQKKIAAGTT